MTALLVIIGIIVVMLVAFLLRGVQFGGDALDAYKAARRRQGKGFVWILLAVMLFAGVLCVRSVVTRDQRDCQRFMTLWKHEDFPDILPRDAEAMIASPSPLSVYAATCIDILGFKPPERRESLDALAINGGKGYTVVVCVNRLGRIHAGIMDLWIADGKIRDIIIDDEAINASLHGR